MSRLSGKEIIENSVNSKTKYRYLDYNPLALGQLPLLIGKKILEFVQDERIKLSTQEKIFERFSLSKNDIDEFEKNKKLYKQAFINIEKPNMKFESKIYIPKKVCDKIYFYSEQVKEYHGTLHDKNIFHNSVCSSIVDYMLLLEEDSFSLTSFLDLSDLKSEILDYVEEELMFPEIQSKYVEYNISYLEIGTEYQMSFGILKDVFPVIRDKYRVPIFINRNMSKEDYNPIYTVKELLGLSDINDQKNYVMEYSSNLISKNYSEIDFFNDIINKKDFESLSKYMLDFLIDIESYSSYASYEVGKYKQLLTGLFLELEYHSKDKNGIKNILIDENVIEQFFNKIKEIKELFYQESTNIWVHIDKSTLSKKFEFISNYEQVKILLDAFSMNKNMSLIVAGPAGIGKTHDIQSLISLMSGNQINPSSIDSDSSFSNIFEKGNINLDSSKRTTELPAIASLILNGNPGKLLLLDEFGRTLMNILDKGVNSDIGKMLTSFEPLIDKSKFYEFDGFGIKDVKVFPAMYLSTVMTTNTVSKNFSTKEEFSRRFRVIISDLDHFGDYNFVEDTMYKLIYEKNIGNFVDNFIGFDEKKYFSKIKNGYIGLTYILNEINKKYGVDIKKSLEPAYKDSLLKSKNERYHSLEQIDKLVDSNGNTIISSINQKNEMLNILSELKIPINVLMLILDLYDNIDIYLKEFKSNNFTNIRFDDYIRFKMIFKVLKHTHDNINEDDMLSFKKDNIKKYIEKKGIHIDDNKFEYMYHSLDIHLMNLYLSSPLLEDKKNDLYHEGSLNQDNKFLLKVLNGDKKVNKMISSFAEIISRYNQKIIEQFKKVRNASSLKSSTFKASDVPVAGFAKINDIIDVILSTDGKLSKEDIENILSSTNKDEFKSLLESLYGTNDNIIRYEKMVSDIGTI